MIKKIIGCIFIAPLAGIWIAAVLTAMSQNWVLSAYIIGLIIITVIGLYLLGL